MVGCTSTTSSRILPPEENWTFNLALHALHAQLSSYVVAIHTKLDIPTLNDRRMQVLPISFWPVLDDGYIQPIMVIVLFSNNGDCLFVR